MDARRKKHVIIWLALVCLLVCLMVVVGGVTRLTNSGLSMVEWKPIMGTIPPLTEAEWLDTFNKYKQFPEYKILNRDMNLSEFKFIFFWEYFHRILGRLIGIVFFLPFLYFLSKRYFDKKLTIKLFIGFILGGMQGLMGWYMVKSGLVDVPHVSHYRLAAHLLLAFVIFAYLLWVIFDLIHEDKKKSAKVGGLFIFSLVITLIVAIQVVYGAFVAGRDAGFVYNTFPTMSGRLIADGWLALDPKWLNFFENIITIQFVHRTIAWLLVAVIVLFWFKARKQSDNPRCVRAAHLLFASILFQFLLGVFTLIYVVPISLAALHQAGALLLFGAALYSNHALISEK